MTQWESLIKCRNHWQWLWITGSADKESYPPSEEWKYGCACCEQLHTDCYVCVLLGYAWSMAISDKAPCADEGSLYFNWLYAETPGERSYWAHQMVNACNKAIEDMILGGKGIPLPTESANCELNETMC